MANGFSCPTKRSLSPARRQLVEVMQEIQFGSIEGLQIINGEPVPNSRFRVLREIVFGKENAPNQVHGRDDFALKAQHIELFDLLDRKRSTTVERLVVQNGLPVRMTVAYERRVR
jgi:hypothetical protein